MNKNDSKKIKRDSERKYKEEFIKEVLKVSKEKKSFTFKGPKSFLEQIENI